MTRTGNKRIDTQLLKEDIKNFLLEHPETLDLLREQRPKIPLRKLSGKEYFKRLWHHLSETELRQLRKYMGKYLKDVLALDAPGSKFTPTRLDRIARAVFRSAGVVSRNTIYVVTKGSHKVVMTPWRLFFKKGMPRAGGGREWPRLRKWAWYGSIGASLFQNQMYKLNPEFEEWLNKVSKEKLGFELGGREWQRYMVPTIMLELFKTANANLYKLSGDDVEHSSMKGWYLSGNCRKYGKNVHDIACIPKLFGDTQKNHCWMEKGEKKCGAPFVSQKNPLARFLVAYYNKKADAVEDKLKDLASKGKHGVNTKKRQDCRNRLTAHGFSGDPEREDKPWTDSQLDGFLMKGGACAGVFTAATRRKLFGLPPSRAHTVPAPKTGATPTEPAKSPKEVPYVPPPG